MRVNVNRTGLLKTVVENKAQHKKDFEEAWQDYLTYAKKEFRKAARNVEKTEKGKRINLPNFYAVPENHESDYDRIAGLLKLSSDDEVWLDDRDYERYVLDKWDWKEQFVSTSNFYKGNI